MDRQKKSDCELADQCLNVTLWLFLTGYMQIERATGAIISVGVN